MSLSDEKQFVRLQNGSGSSGSMVSADVPVKSGSSTYVRPKFSNPGVVANISAKQAKFLASGLESLNLSAAVEINAHDAYPGLISSRVATPAMIERHLAPFKDTRDTEEKEYEQLQQTKLIMTQALSGRLPSHRPNSCLIGSRPQTSQYLENAGTPVKRISTPGSGLRQTWAERQTQIVAAAVSKAKQAADAAAKAADAASRRPDTAILVETAAEAAASAAAAMIAAETLSRPSTSNHRGESSRRSAPASRPLTSRSLSPLAEFLRKHPEFVSGAASEPRPETRAMMYYGGGVAAALTDTSLQPIAGKRVPDSKEGVENGRDTNRQWTEAVKSMEPNKGFAFVPDPLATANHSVSCLCNLCSVHRSKTTVARAPFQLDHDPTHYDPNMSSTMTEFQGHIPEDFVPTVAASKQLQKPPEENISTLLAPASEAGPMQKSVTHATFIRQEPPPSSEYQASLPMYTKNMKTTFELAENNDTTYKENSVTHAQFSGYPGHKLKLPKMSDPEKTRWTSTNIDLSEDNVSSRHWQSETRSNYLLKTLRPEDRPPATPLAKVQNDDTTRMKTLLTDFFGGHDDIAEPTYNYKVHHVKRPWTPRSKAPETRDFMTTNALAYNAHNARMKKVS